VSKKPSKAELAYRKRLAEWMDRQATASYDAMLITREEYEEAIARVLRGKNALEEDK